MHVSISGPLAAAPGPCLPRGSAPQWCPMKIRDGTAIDAADLARIYNHYVLHSHATFDTEPETVEDPVSYTHLTLPTILRV